MDYCDYFDRSQHDTAHVQRRHGAHAAILHVRNCRWRDQGAAYSEAFRIYRGGMYNEDLELWIHMWAGKGGKGPHLQ